MAKTKKTKISDEQIVLFAQKHLHEDSDFEIDSSAKISRGAEDGVYVQGWKFVRFDEIREQLCRQCGQNVTDKYDVDGVCQECKTKED